MFTVRHELLFEAFLGVNLCLSGLIVILKTDEIRDDHALKLRPFIVFGAFSCVCDTRK